MVEAAGAGANSDIETRAFLRRKMTLPEVVLWQELRRGKLKGLQFRRQHPIGPYILDFYCSAARLAIEIDGSSHASDVQAKHDQRRDRWLRDKGITVVRVGAADVLRDENLESLLTYIAQVAAPSTAFGGPLPRFAGEEPSASVVVANLSTRMNTLYYGDNLEILREHVKDETVDLVYLDPPFNSNASCNVLFKAPDGHESHAQMEAFEDTWHWDAPAEKAFDEVMQSGNADAAEMLRAMRAFLHENDMMAYLAMMAVRLLELHRVLKPTGS